MRKKIKDFSCNKKKKITLNLSLEAIEIIHEKADFFKKRGLSRSGTSDAADWMIRDFSRSTPQERLYQSKAKMEARERFIKQDYDPKLTMKDLLRRAWDNGHRCGWEHFQTRKLSNPFRKKLVGG